MAVRALGVLLSEGVMRGGLSYVSSTKFGGVLSKGRLEWLGPLVLGLMVLAAIFVPPGLQELAFRYDLDARLLGPMSRHEGQLHFLGTDHLGRDVMGRLLIGARYALFIGLSSVVLSGTIGAVLGLVAGYYGKLIDMPVMRLVDLQLAFPFILLAMAMVAIVGATVQGIIVVFVVTSWPTYARLVRGVVLSLREKEFVEAARAIGASDGRILRRHIAPACLGLVAVIASYEVARLVITEAALGYLGVGIRPPTPTWGNMLADGRDYMRSAFWLTLWPGLAIFLLALAVNMTAELIGRRGDGRRTSTGE